MYNSNFCELVEKSSVDGSINENQKIIQPDIP